jgi:Fur family transcriptional regulator, ferric uptake regulator
MHWLQILPRNGIVIMSKRSSQSTALDSIRKQIHAAGLRSTMARLSVMKELIAAKTPLSHAQMSDRLSSKGFDRATIYRNLVELSEAGLVNRIELGDHVWRFELRRRDDESAEHPHFVCVECGEVSCLPTGSVSIKHARGIKPEMISDVTEVLLKGHCGNCS